MQRFRRIVDIAPPEKKDLIKQERAHDKKKKRKTFSLKKTWFFGGAILLIIGIVAVVGAIHFLFSYAKITVWPQTRTLNLSQTVSVQANQRGVDFVGNILPGKIFQVEKTVTKLFPATGMKNQESSAQGSIMIFNNQAKPQILVATTRFMSQDGKLFRSTVRVVIPANSSLAVPVTAAETGPEYNIGSSNFSLPGLAGTPLYTFVYGKSSQSMAGGTRSNVSVVTAFDIDQARSSLLDSVTKLAKDALIKQVQSPWSVEYSAFDVATLEAASLVKEGAQLQQFNFKASIRVTALAYQPLQLADVAIYVLQAQMQEGEMLNQKTLVVSALPKNFDVAGEKLSLLAGFGVHAYHAVNLPDIQNNLHGQQKIAAEIFLRDYPAISKFQIELWPFWLMGVPQDVQRIKVSLVLD